MLPNTAATMRQSSAVPMTAGTKMLTMVDVTETLLEGVASTLLVIETTLIVASTLVVIETVLIVEVAKRVWVSKRCVPICGTLLSGGVTADSELVTSAVSLCTSDDCDDGISVTNELVTSVVSLYTSDDCNDGVSAEYVDTVEQSMGSIGPTGTQLHFKSEFMQLLIIQPLLLSKVMLVSDVEVSEVLPLTVTLPMHHQVTLVVTREQENGRHALLTPVQNISQHRFQVHDMSQVGSD